MQKLKLSPFQLFALAFGGVFNRAAPIIRKFEDGRYYIRVRSYVPFKRRSVERQKTLYRNSLRAR